MFCIDGLCGAAGELPVEIREVVGWIQINIFELPFLGVLMTLKFKVDLTLIPSID